MNYKRYKQLIKEKGLKQTYIAKKIGISTTMLSLYLNGVKGLSKPNELLLAKALA